jgi:anti-sigma-K factor RskA
MTAPNHDRLADLSAVYALGALRGEERAEFEAHLRECTECAAEVEAFAPVVAGLASSVPSREPPAALRDRVLASVQAGPSSERGAAPTSDTARRGSGQVSRQASGQASRSGSVQPSLLGSRQALPAWLLAAASLVAAVGLGWQTVRLQSTVRTLEARLQEAAIRENLTEREIADARTAAGEAQSIVAVLTSLDLVRVDLAGQPPAVQAFARAFWSRSRGLVFNAARLPPAPAGKTYQLWVVTASAPLSVGLLRPDVSGSVTTVVNTPPDIEQPVAMAVTVEPEGGVPAPTGEKYLIGTVGN